MTQTPVTAQPTEAEAGLRAQLQKAQAAQQRTDALFVECRAALDAAIQRGAELNVTIRGFEKQLAAANEQVDALLEQVNAMQREKDAAAAEHASMQQRLADAEVEADAWKGRYQTLRRKRSTSRTSS